MIRHIDRGGEFGRRDAPIRVLLVEDNPADVDLTCESFAEGRVRVDIDVVTDGEEAIDYLTRTGRHVAAQSPQLIILDLNLPRRGGHEVLGAIKSNGPLRRIPVVVLSSSTAQRDVVASYELGASCYLAKPLDLDSYRRMVRSVEEFWFEIAVLPAGSAVIPVRARR